MSEDGDIIISLDTKRILALVLILALSAFSIYGYIAAIFTFVPPSEDALAHAQYAPPGGGGTNKPPVARAGPDRKAFVGRPIVFDASKSSDPEGIVKYFLWEFGDGQKSTQKKKEHAYTAAGNYTVTLTVKDVRMKTDTDTLKVTVMELPIEPVGEAQAGLDVEPKQNYVLDASEQADTTLTLNSTDQVNVWVFKYPSNPHPEAPLPEHSLPTVVDIAVSTKESITWPMHIERHYTDEEAAGIEESQLGIYYYKEGAWHTCRETGVHEDRNIVWANMYEDEVTGSLTIIAEKPVAALFEAVLALEPEEVELDEEATVTFTVTNIGEETGNYTWTMMVNSVELENGTVTLSGNESETITRTLSYDEAGAYLIEMGGLAARLKVTAFQVEISVSPQEVTLNEQAFVTITVTNMGVLGEYRWTLKVDGVEVDYGTVTLAEDESETITTTLSYEEADTYSLEADGATATLTVTAALAPAQFEGSGLSISPAEVEPGEDVTVSVNVENVGEEQGFHHVEFKMDGVAVIYELVTLDGGESTTVEATLFTEEEGEHIVEVEGITGTFTVTPPPSKKFPWGLTIGAVVIIIAAVVYMYLRQSGTPPFSEKPT